MQHEVAQVLEPLYKAGEEWEKLQEVYKLELQRLTDPGERQNLLRRMADLAENKLFDQVQAFEWWSRGAVSEEPAARRQAAQDELLRLARVHPPVGRLRRHHARGGPAAPATRPCAGTCCMRLATVFEADLADLARAEEVLHQVLAEHPTDVAALAFLDRIYDRQGTFDQLAEVLRRRLAVTVDSQELVALHLRLGRVLADVLADPVGAIASYQAVLEQDTRNSEALEALERLYLRGERWKDLYAVYEKMLDVATTPATQADCYARMARLSSEAFEDRPKAVTLWRKVLDLRGADPVGAGGAGRSARAGGRVARADRGHRQPDPGHRPIPTDRIPLYKRLGRIWGDKLQRERNALESWQQVLEIDPGDVEALRAIAENYRIAGRLGGAVRYPAAADRPGRRGPGRRRAQGAVRPAGRAGGRHPHAHRPGHPGLAARARAGRGRLPGAGRARDAVHAGGALGGVRRGARAALGRAGQPRGPGRRPHAGRQHLGRQDRRRRRGGRGLRADPGPRPGQHDRLDRARAAVPPAQELDEAGRAAAVAHRVHRRPQGADPAAAADRRDLRAGAGRSGQRLRDPAGRLPRGLLERPRGGRARAAGHGGRALERAAVRLHPGRPDHPRRPAGRRPVGQDRPLVRLGGQPHRLRHRLGQPGPAARSGPRRGADGAGGLLPQAGPVARAGDGAGPPRRGGVAGRAQGRAAARRWPTSTRPSWATPPRPCWPTSRRWTTTTAAWRRSTPSSACTAAPRPGTGWSTCSTARPTRSTTASWR